MFEYKIIRQKRSTIAITVLQNGDVIVKAPQSLSLARIEKFVNEKSDWIVRKRQNALIKFAMLPTIKNGETIKIVGQEYVIKTYDGKKAFENNGELYLPQKNTMRYLQIVCAHKLLAYIEPKVYYYAEKNFLVISDIKIVNTGHRWGSCSKDNVLRFNVSLALVPTELIDYVICHEACHVREKNHGKAFYALVKKNLPDYKLRQAELKTHSAFCSYFKNDR